jgi:hypothetical protein
MKPVYSTPTGDRVATFNPATAAFDDLTFSGAVAGYAIEAGHVDGGDVLWRWGVNESGQIYFDTTGVEAGEEQILMLDDGLFYVKGAPL